MRIFWIMIILSQILFIGVVNSSITVHASPDNGSLESGSPKYIWFSGYEWKVKSGHYAPGKNEWRADNAWVDIDGYLHLKITQQAGNWYCAEVTSLKPFGYGVYQFQVISQIEKLDPNMVFGLFVYPSEEKESNKDNEIDIEFAQWGKLDAPRGNYTVTPDVYSFPFSLEGNYTVHQFTWDSQQVQFQSFHGHMPAKKTEFSNYLYIPSDYGKIAPVPPVRVHMNFWLFLGDAPLDNEEREVVIRSFKFIPYTLSK